MGIGPQDLRKPNPYGFAKLRHAATLLSRTLVPAVLPGWRYTLGLYSSAGCGQHSPLGSTSIPLVVTLCVNLVLLAIVGLDPKPLWDILWNLGANQHGPPAVHSACLQKATYEHCRDLMLGVFGAAAQTATDPTWAMTDVAKKHCQRMQEQMLEGQGNNCWCHSLGAFSKISERPQGHSSMSWQTDWLPSVYKFLYQSIIWPYLYKFSYSCMARLGMFQIFLFYFLVQISSLNCSLFSHFTICS